MRKIRKIGKIKTSNKIRIFKKKIFLKKNKIYKILKISKKIKYFKILKILKKNTSLKEQNKLKILFEIFYSKKNSPKLSTLSRRNGTNYKNYKKTEILKILTCRTFLSKIKNWRKRFSEFNQNWTRLKSGPTRSNKLGKNSKNKKIFFKFITRGWSRKMRNFENKLKN